MNKSLNQLYKEQVKHKLTNLPFKEWVEKGKGLYENYMKAEMISPDVTFEMFANMIQPQIVLSEDGTTTTKSFWDTSLGKLLTTGATVGADLIKQQTTTTTTPTPSTTSTPSVPNTNASSLPPAKSKTILGLTPIVFYSLATVTVLGVGFAIYKLVSKKS
jgi:hypothetical protein